MEFEVLFWVFLASAGDLLVLFSSCLSSFLPPSPFVSSQQQSSVTAPMLTIPALGLSGHLFLIPASCMFSRLDVSPVSCCMGSCAEQNCPPVRDMAVSGLVLLGRARYWTQRQVGPPGTKESQPHTVRGSSLTQRWEEGQGEE